MYVNCRVPDCNNNDYINKQGLCIKHYNNFSQKHKEKTVEEFVNYCVERKRLKSERCRVPGCKNKRWTLWQGLCKKHNSNYNTKLHKDKTVEEFIEYCIKREKSRNRKCIIDVCKNKAHVVSQGLCEICYKRYREYHQDKTIEEFNAYCSEKKSLLSKKCLIPHCGMATKAKGLCSKHYTRYDRRYKNRYTVKQFIERHIEGDVLK